MRICILSKDNTPAGFLDNEAPKALHFYDDLLHTYLKGSAHTLSFRVHAAHPDAQLLTVGSKLVFFDKGRPYCMTILSVFESEQEVEVSAFSLSFELLNETANAYTATKAMSFVEYIRAFGFEFGSGRGDIEIGINEVSDKRIQHEWEGNTDTVLARLFSLASVFDAELEFVPMLNRDYSLQVVRMNVYRAHDETHQGIGQNRQDVVLRYGKEISGITRKTDISELFTAIRPTGAEDLTLASYPATQIKDENGNVEYEHPAGRGEILAPMARDRFPSNTLKNSTDRYIAYNWKTDYKTAAELYSNALAKLKTLSQPQVTYEIDGYTDLQIGDTVRVADEAFHPALYLQVRVKEQEISFTEPDRNKTTYDNITELESQIDDALTRRMEELAEAAAEAQAAAEAAAAAAEGAGSRIWTSTAAPASPNYTFTIANLEGDSDAAVKVGDIILYSYYRYTVTTVSNTTVLAGRRTSIRGAKGATGSAGEDAVLLRIDSSRGNLFKNNSVSTTLSVTVYCGPERITDITALQSRFGSGAHLEWYWQKVDEDSFHVISASDSRLSNSGFNFTLTPDDVDVKVTFMCQMIID